MGNINKWNGSDRSRVFPYRLRGISIIAYAFAVVMVCACASTRVYGQVQNPETVLSHSVAIDHFAPYIANFETETGAGKISGVVYGNKVAGSTYKRTELAQTVGGQKIQTVVIETPSMSCVVIPSAKQIIKTKKSLMDSQLTLDRLLTNPANYSLEMTTENVAGHKCFKLDIRFRGPELDKLNTELRALAPNAPALARQERWVDASDHLVRKIATYDQSGKLINTLEYSNVRVGVKVDPSLFKLPAGYNVVETTGAAATIKAIAENEARAQVRAIEKARTKTRNNTVSFLVEVFFGMLVVLIVIGRLRKMRTTAR